MTFPDLVKIMPSRPDKPIAEFPQRITITGVSRKRLRGGRLIMPWVDVQISTGDGRPTRRWSLSPGIIEDGESGLFYIRSIRALPAAMESEALLGGGGQRHPMINRYWCTYRTTVLHLLRANAFDRLLKFHRAICALRKACDAIAELDHATLVCRHARIPYNHIARKLHLLISVNQARYDEINMFLSDKPGRAQLERRALQIPDFPRIASEAEDSIENPLRSISCPPGW